MKKISEKNLSNIIKRNFNSNAILVNFKGIINGRILLLNQIAITMRKREFYIYLTCVII